MLIEPYRPTRLSWPAFPYPTADAADARITPSNEIETFCIETFVKISEPPKIVALVSYDPADAVVLEAFKTQFYQAIDVLEAFCQANNIDIPLVLPPYNPNPDVPFTDADKEPTTTLFRRQFFDDSHTGNQSAIYFNDIFAILCELLFQLYQGEYRFPNGRHQLKRLLPELGSCGPALYHVFLQCHTGLNQQSLVPHWLQEWQAQLCHAVAEVHCQEYALHPSYHKHVLTAILQQAPTHQFDPRDYFSIFNPYNGKSTAVADPHTAGCHLEDGGLAHLFDILKSQYTAVEIANLIFRRTLDFITDDFDKHSIGYTLDATYLRFPLAANPYPLIEGALKTLWEFSGLTFTSPLVAIDDGTVRLSLDHLRAIFNLIFITQYVFNPSDDTDEEKEENGFEAERLGVKFNYVRSAPEIAFVSKLESTEDNDIITFKRWFALACDHHASLADQPEQQAAHQHDVAAVCVKMFDLLADTDNLLLPLLCNQLASTNPHIDLLQNLFRPWFNMTINDNVISCFYHLNAHLYPLVLRIIGKEMLQKKLPDLLDVVSVLQYLPTHLIMPTIQDYFPEYCQKHLGFLERIQDFAQLLSPTELETLLARHTPAQRKTAFNLPGAVEDFLVAHFYPDTRARINQTYFDFKTTVPSPTADALVACESISDSLSWLCLFPITPVPEAKSLFFARESRLFNQQWRALQRQCVFAQPDLSTTTTLTKILNHLNRFISHRHYDNAAPASLKTHLRRLERQLRRQLCELAEAPAAKDDSAKCFHVDFSTT